MPIHYLISEKKRLVVTTASGILTFAEAKAHQDQLVADPNLNPSFNQLLDTTAVIGFQISAREASGLARRPVFSTSSKRAFVASNPLAFGMGRLMQAYQELSEQPPTVRVFHDLTTALEWLGVEGSLEQLAA